MDKKNRQILDALKEDSSLSTRQVSKRTKIPLSTVHNRIKKLKERGIIKRFTIEVDNKKIGKPFSAIVLISCDYRLLRESNKSQHQLAEELMGIAEVEKVDIVSGKTDIVARIRVKNVEEFDSFLLKKFQKIAGIESTQSLVIIHEF